MKLDDEEKAMLAGAFGPARQWAVKHQMQVGAFFDAEDMVAVGQAHVMADTESTGEAGVKFLEDWADLPHAQRRVRIPTITDPRGVDFNAYRRLKQTDGMAEMERRLIRAFESLSVLMTNTCINYQTILPPVRGEHLAFGDTGVVIYSNSVMGARSNFEGGPSAVAAGLTGRTPRYGYHLPERRIGTRHFDASAAKLGNLSDWGALGGARWPGDGQLLGSASYFRTLQGSEFGRAQTFRCCAGKFWVRGDVSHARSNARSSELWPRRLTVGPPLNACKLARTL